MQALEHKSLPFFYKRLGEIYVRQVSFKPGLRAHGGFDHPDDC